MNAREREMFWLGVLWGSIFWCSMLGLVMAVLRILPH